MFFLFGSYKMGRVRELDYNSACLQDIMRNYREGFINEVTIVDFLSEYADFIESENFDWVMGIDNVTGATTPRYTVKVEYQVTEI